MQVLNKIGTMAMLALTQYHHSVIFGSKKSRDDKIGMT